MILISHFSLRFSKLLGNNSVSVLATLILLSYTKILCTLIAAINITYLEYPTYNRGVWLYDANVNYLVGEHIPIFLVALLVFIFLFLPYTLLLLFGQWLPAISHLKLFSCMGQQCQAETFYGLVSCSIQSKTSVLAWIAACASLCSSPSVCFESSARPQY